MNFARRLFQTMLELNFLILILIIIGVCSSYLKRIFILYISYIICFLLITYGDYIGGKNYFINFKIVYPFLSFIWAVIYLFVFFLINYRFNFTKTCSVFNHIYLEINFRKFSLILIYAFIEEVFYRIIIFSYFDSMFNNSIISIILSSFLFCLNHIYKGYTTRSKRDICRIMELFIFSSLLFLIFKISDSIWLVFLFHFYRNLIISNIALRLDKKYD